MIAQCLDDLRRPPGLAELRSDLRRLRGKFGGQRLVHKLTHGRVGAFHEQPLKLNDHLNNAVGLNASLRGQNGGLL